MSIGEWKSAFEDYEFIIALSKTEQLSCSMMIVKFPYWVSLYHNHGVCYMKFGKGIDFRCEVQNCIVV
jgi:hypothetical protein